VIVDYTCTFFGFDHPIYPNGCPFPLGWRPVARPRRRLTEQEQRQAAQMEARLTRQIEARERQAEAERQAAEALKQERSLAKTRALLREVLQEASDAEHAALEADLERFHELRDGLRAAEDHEQRERVRRLRQRLR
jgi:hypothetical protein